MADVANTWVSIAEVLSFTGATVDADDVLIAQNVIQGAINRVYRATDATEDGRDYYWLKRAVAWQAKGVVDQPELYGLPAGVSSLSQDGFSISFDTSTSGGGGRHLHPIAISMLNNLRQGANTSLRVNSAFQGGTRRRVSRPGWRPA